MAIRFRINGTNNVQFDQGVSGRYAMQGPPRGMSTPFTREEVLRELRRLPRDIRGHVLNRGLSRITFDFDINGSSDADMEDAEHDLLETLQDTLLYFSTRGARGTEATFETKSDGAAASSYKSIFYGELDEQEGRHVLGRRIKDHTLYNMRLTLYCEPYWHPASTTNLVNASTVYNHDDADSGHNNYVDIAAANIAGDVMPRIRLRFNTEPSDWSPAIVYMSRRSRGTPANHVHVFEAENATTETNWADAVDSTCSNGNKKRNSASTSGNAEWSVSLPSDDRLGRFRVLGRVKTDDITNTKLRFSYRTNIVQDWLTNKWYWPPYQAEWCLIDLGSAHFDPNLRSGVSLYDLEMKVEYEKDAADYIDFDFFYLLPEDESIGILEQSKEYDDSVFVWDNTGDFDVAAAETPTTPKYIYDITKRGIFTLGQNETNRLYFIQLSSDDEWFISHQTLPNPAEVTIDYLPQYISPLE